MKYLTIKTDKTTNKTTRRTVQADNIKQARTKADPTSNDTLRCYLIVTNSDGSYNADALQQAALTIVKRTTANMVSNQGGRLQYELYNACRVPNIDNTDIDDMLSVAQLALCEAVADGKDTPQQYAFAYQQLQKYLYSVKAVDTKAQSKRCINLESLGFDIAVDIDGNINRVLSIADDNYYYSADATDDIITSDIVDALQSIFEILTPRQQKVYKYLACGMSETQIGDIMGVSHQAIHKHIVLIRTKATTLYPNGINSIIK